ncbi:hypothetical protein B0H14DRAFT_3428398 [Mycena olivaceomarginata]|nr:hypothetical protein B0H14DRAFT_3428398 [Mycena olivaceomarginata]
MEEAKGEDFLDKAVKALEKYQIKFMRKSYGPRLNVFAPIHALSSLSKTNWEDCAVIPGKKDDMAIAGGQILGDEHSKHNWSGIFLQGTLLTTDQWHQESHHASHIYALG